MSNTTDHCHKDCAPVGHVRGCSDYNPTDKVQCLTFEESLEAVKAISTLVNLGIINWKPVPLEQDSLGIDKQAELILVAHDGYVMSTSLFTCDKLNERTVYFAVGKQMVQEAFGG
jgi:hypothetical protein